MFAQANPRGGEALCPAGEAARCKMPKKGKEILCKIEYEYSLTSMCIFDIIFICSNWKALWSFPKSTF